MFITSGFASLGTSLGKLNLAYPRPSEPYLVKYVFHVGSVVDLVTVDL